MPGSIDAFVVDRDLAELLAREDERDEQGMGGAASVDEMIDSIPGYDDGPAPDPFADLPAGMG